MADTCGRCGHCPECREWILSGQSYRESKAARGAGALAVGMGGAGGGGNTAGAGGYYCGGETRAGSEGMYYPGTVTISRTEYEELLKHRSYSRPVLTQMDAERLANDPHGGAAMLVHPDVIAMTVCVWERAQETIRRHAANCAGWQKRAEAAEAKLAALTPKPEPLLPAVRPRAWFEQTRRGPFG